MCSHNSATLVDKHYRPMRAVKLFSKTAVHIVHSTLCWLVTLALSSETLRLCASRLLKKVHWSQLSEETCQDSPSPAKEGELSPPLSLFCIILSLKGAHYAQNVLSMLSGTCCTLQRLHCLNVKFNAHVIVNNNRIFFHNVLLVSVTVKL